MATWKFPEMRLGKEASDDLRQRRADMLAIEGIQTFDPAASVYETEIDDVRCLIVEGEAPQTGTLLYFHGGGFRLGRPEQCAGLASRLARMTGLRIILPEYRLAPEFPFPAAMNDAARVYDAVATGPMLLGGDSAGGGLAASLAAAAAKAQRRKPDGLILLSPWLDLTVTAESYSSAADTDAVFSRDAAIEAASAYLADFRSNDPLASPLFADPGAFPTSWICASGDEVLRDDSIAFAQQLRSAGVRVDLSIWPQQDHVWPILKPASDATRHVLESITRFVARLA